MVGGQQVSVPHSSGGQRMRQAVSWKVCQRGSVGRLTRRRQTHRLVITALGELGLNCDRVDTMRVHAFTDTAGNFHVVPTRPDQHMDRCDHGGLGQLPYVKLVDRHDTRYRSDRVSHRVERNVRGDTLHENVRCRLDQRQCRREDDTGDEERDTRVEV